jgi:adenylate kinase
MTEAPRYTLGRPTRPLGGLEGRAHHAGEIRQRLAPGKNVALLGLGGSGKSALVGWLCDQQWAIDLAPVGRLWLSVGKSQGEVFPRWTIRMHEWADQLEISKDEATTATRTGLD